MRRYLITNKDINEYLCKKDPVFKEIIRRCKTVKIELDRNYFGSSVKSIIGQQLSKKVATVIYVRMNDLCENNISPETIFKLSNENLRTIGLSHSKINYIRNLAEAVSSRKISFENIENMSNDEIVKMLTSVKGIGHWTSEMFLIFSLGREDIFSERDGGLQRSISTMYKVDRKLTKESLKEISDAWKPYRTYASLYLWELINKNII